MIRGSCFLAFVGLLVPLLAGPIHAQDPDLAPDALRALCSTCHRDEFDALGQTPHGVLESEEFLQQSGEVVGCLACHGDSSEHIRNGGGRGSIFAFGEEDAGVQTGRCLSCHLEDHPRYTASTHASAGLSCATCHQIHSSGLPSPVLLRDLDASAGTERPPGISSQCLYCHRDVSAQFAFTERHRLEEGVIDCASCHDPHQPLERSLFGAVGQEQCSSCHSDKGGPFVFEHGASLVEGCTSCHTPHGSPNRHLLLNQQVGELCVSCHATVPQFHLGFNPAAPSQFGLDTQCTDCHVTIHGSNFDPFFLR